MSIQTFPSASGGTKWDDYPFRLLEGAFTPSSSGVYETLLSVNGKGFLSEANFRPISSDNIRVKLTLDGELILNLNFSATNPCGIFLPGFMSGSSYSLKGADTNAVEVPQFPGHVIWHRPRFFTTSLLIEVYRGDTYGTKYRISGGW